MKVVYHSYFLTRCNFLIVLLRTLSGGILRTKNAIIFNLEMSNLLEGQIIDCMHKTLNGLLLEPVALALAQKHIMHNLWLDLL